ncbi:branched-chain amino acid ABC transporter permease [Nocardioides sp.]|uniref:branched-chain amino acid ABC transporter permease n=1 Tax=Nocardioides sp. TaxID=35761 RepID=UPI003782FE88
MTALAQALAGSAVDGLLYGVLAAGLGLIFAVTGRLHFAMAASFVLAVFVAADAVERGAPFGVAAALGLLVGTGLGLLVEVVVYAPIVRRAPDVALLSVFVAGIGVVTVCENAVRLVWPVVESRQLDPGIVPERIVLWGDVGVTNLDVVVGGLAVALLIGLQILLSHTPFGQQVHATRGNPLLATLVGISELRIRLCVFAIGSFLVAVVGIATAIRSTVTPSGGIEPTFMAIVVLFLAGTGSSPARFAVAGLAVAAAEALCAVYVSSAWSPIVVFGILFGYIALTPTVENLRERRARGLRTARIASVR